MFLVFNLIVYHLFRRKKAEGGEISEGYIYPGVIPIVVIVVVVRS